MIFQNNNSIIMNSIILVIYSRIFLLEVHHSNAKYCFVTPSSHYQSGHLDTQTSENHPQDFCNLLCYYKHPTFNCESLDLPSQMYQSSAKSCLSISFFAKDGLEVLKSHFLYYNERPIGREKQWNLWTLKLEIFDRMICHCN